MIITQRKMCRESRKVFEFLDDLAVKNGVQGIITPAHICICDMLVCSFYTQAIINVMKNKLQHMGKKNSHHFEITYWDPIVRTMLNDKGAMRNSTLPSTLMEGSYDVLNGLMIVDYSVDDVLMMADIASRYGNVMVDRACNVARTAGVYNTQYVRAVLERNKAMNDIHANRIYKLGEEIKRSDDLLNKEIKQHSPIDVAIAQYEYQRKIEDYELEQKMNRLLEGM